MDFLNKLRIQACRLNKFRYIKKQDVFNIIKTSSNLLMSCWYYLDKI